jgi:hypothetical protein
MQSRHQHLIVLLELLLAKAGAGSAETEAMVDFSEHEVLETFRGDLSLQGDHLPNPGDTLLSLLTFAHQSKLIDLRNGKALITTAITLRLNPAQKQRKRVAGFTKGDFAPLAAFYEERILQIHVMAEYARVATRKIAAHVAMIADYFRLSKTEFFCDEGIGSASCPEDVNSEGRLSPEKSNHADIPEGINRDGHSSIMLGPACPPRPDRLAIGAVFRQIDIVSTGTCKQRRTKHRSPEEIACDVNGAGWIDSHAEDRVAAAAGHRFAATARLLGPKKLSLGPVFGNVDICSRVAASGQGGSSDGYRSGKMASRKNVAALVYSHRLTVTVFTSAHARYPAEFRGLRLRSGQENDQTGHDGETISPVHVHRDEILFLALMKLVFGAELISLSFRGRGPEGGC